MSQAAADTWVDDVLGPPYRARTLELGRDEEGELVATVVRYDKFPTPQEDTELPRRAILYVHGFLDYFFNAELGPLAAEQGYQFYALDLRKCGRSLRPSQTINFTTDLSVHREEIKAALDIIRGEDDHEEVVLVGHSTGGLVTSLWAHANRGSGLIDALVLNSPWLDIPQSKVRRAITRIALPWLGRIRPRAKAATLPGRYGEWLAAPGGGGWDFNHEWRPIGDAPLLAGFGAAVVRAQNTVAKGLDIDVPILMATSDASSDGNAAQIDSTDIVLWVEQMWQRAPLLGPDVTIRKIAGGVHDLALSRPGPRAQYHDTVFDWLAARLG